MTRHSQARCGQSVPAEAEPLTFAACWQRLHPSLLARAPATAALSGALQQLALSYCHERLYLQRSLSKPARKGSLGRGEWAAKRPKRNVVA